MLNCAALRAGSVRARADQRATLLSPPPPPLPRDKFSVHLGSDTGSPFARSVLSYDDKKKFIKSLACTKTGHS